MDAIQRIEFERVRALLSTCALRGRNGIEQPSAIIYSSIRHTLSKYLQLLLYWDPYRNGDYILIVVSVIIRRIRVDCDCWEGEQPVTENIPLRYHYRGAKPSQLRSRFQLMAVIPSDTSTSALTLERPSASPPLNRPPCLLNASLCPLSPVGCSR